MRKEMLNYIRMVMIYRHVFFCVSESCNVEKKSSF